MAKSYDFTTLKKAIKNSGAFYSVISKRLGCEWHTAKKYVEANEDALKLMEVEKENLLDLAESKLIANIKDQDNTAIIFYLKTQGKKRGYIEKTEQLIEHKDQEQIRVIIEEKKP